MAVKSFYKKIIVILLSIILLLLTCYRVSSLWNRLLPDFSIFYFSAIGILHGINPYHNRALYAGFVSPIFTIIGYFPFIIFRFQDSQNLFLIVSIMSFFVSVIFSLKIIKRLTLINFLTISILGNLSFPIKFTLGMGQGNLIAIASTILSYYFCKGKKQYLSAILISVAIIFKPILVFLMLFYLLRKQWKIFFTASLIILFLVSVTSLIFGPSYYFEYLTKIGPGITKNWIFEPYYNQGIRAFISRLIASPLWGKPLVVLTDLLLVLTLICLSFSKKLSKDTLFCAFLIVLNLIDPISWQHHFVFLIFPFIFLFFQIGKSKTKKWLQYLILTLAYFLISINISYPQVFSQFPQNLLLSHVFYGGVLLFILILKVKTHEK